MGGLELVYFVCMKIILFEGIAGSGKTTLEKLLAEQLADSIIVSEDKTLMALVDNRDVSVALGYLHSILDEVKIHNTSYLILDRFHLTHAFRTKSKLSDFSIIEDELAKLGNVLIVLLVIDEKKIQQRIEETMTYRENGWTLGGQGAKTLEEKKVYYRNQQKVLKEELRQSRFQSIVIDTTEKEWRKNIEQIMDSIKK